MPWRPSDPAAAAPLSAVFWAATLQGARPYNEDRVTACPPHYFAVHDGHGGAAAADRLAARAERRFREPAPPQALAPFYHAAARALARERSGVVSVSALLPPDAGDEVHFAWVGDCQGCVFDRHDDRDRDDAPAPPTVSMALVGSADAPPGDDRDHPVPDTLGLAATDPHALRLPVTGWRRRRTHGHIAFGVPRGFRDPVSDREWRLASRLLAAQGRIPAHMHEPPVEDGEELHEEAARAGAPDAPMLVEVTHAAPHAAYVRFLGSVEPTRSLGDADTAVMSHPELRSARFTTPPGQGAAAARVLLLTSDGAFDGDAFASMEDLCAFLNAPLRFLRTRFYHGAQHLTRRLLSAGALPPEALSPEQEPAGGGGPPLYRQWRACDTWPKAVAFLQQHARLVRARAAVRDDPWLDACDASARWLRTHLAHRAPTLAHAPHHLVCCAAHLAVLMGSQDNVTLLLAPVPSRTSPAGGGVAAADPPPPRI